MKVFLKDFELIDYKGDFTAYLPVQPFEEYVAVGTPSGAFMEVAISHRKEQGDSGHIPPLRTLQQNSLWEVTSRQGQLCLASPYLDYNWDASLIVQRKVLDNTLYVLYCMLWVPVTFKMKKPASHCHGHSMAEVTKEKPLLMR